MKNVAAAACVAAAVSGAVDVRADLPRDVEVLSAAYGSLGTVWRLAPRFLSGGPPVYVALPRSATRRDASRCTAVVVLGAVSTTFVLRVPLRDSSPQDPHWEQVPSAAGIAGVTRCGADREALMDLSLEMRSPHGIVEIVVTDSPGTLPSPLEVLPHRDPGAIPVAVRPGPPPPPNPLRVRVDVATRRLEEATGSQVERRLVAPSEHGSGSTLVELEAGCHRFAVLGLPVEGAAPFHDIDVQLSWVSGEVADADRAESPDASLFVCTGEKRTGILQFAGSEAGVPVVVLRAASPLPPHVPSEFGPEARARIARALAERRIAAPQGPARFAALGVAGITALPVELEAGQCYLATLALVQGESKLLALTATLGRERAFAHVDDASTAVALTFCSRADRAARLDVEVHGSSLVWGAALFPLSRLQIGEESP